jgi:hypothetical protein
MMSDGDDEQLLATNDVDNAIRPVAQRSTTYTATNWFADILEIEKKCKLALDGLNKPLAISWPLLIIVIARFEKLATSLITDDENACHTSHEARGSHLHRE